jgi:hypothetical protein
MYALVDFGQHANYFQLNGPTIKSIMQLSARKAIPVNKDINQSNVKGSIYAQKF